MSNTINTNEGLIDDAEKNPVNQFREYPGTVFDSFTGEDKGGDSSIGSGSADQGMDPGEEKEEDEFRKEPPDLSAGENDLAETNDAGEQLGKFGGAVGNLSDNSSSGDSSGNTEKNDDGNKGHGLVEEGPGPDS